MALSDLIYEVEASHANLYSVFFDMENAFPRVWTYHICTILRQLGVCGPFPLLLQNYLQKRTFCVRAASHHSSTHNQENGIPQGSPLNGNLFLIAINGITGIINSLALFQRLQYPSPISAHRLLQKKSIKLTPGSLLVGSLFPHSKSTSLLSKNANH